MKITLKGLAVTALAVLLTVPAAADDGEMFRRNVSKTPDLETDHATMKMMKFYVPAQTSAGEVITLDYFDVDGVTVDRREVAKPLVAFYHDGEVVHVPDTGFPGHGKRDVFGAVSLDDGATWKRRDLSRSGDLSSFTLRDGTVYFGDTFRLAAAVDGNQAMVAWASRYCQSGSPLYSWEDASKDAFLAAFPELANPVTVIENANQYELYTDDLFGISGAQGSIDFADEDYPTVGEVPYACLWAARGTLEQVDADGVYDPNGGLYGMVWRTAERITSGVRDVHRIEVHAAENAGFVITWQEDPDGLRPGKGLGPGAGWSGAIAHQQTDIWYSHIAWDHFDQVCTDDPGDGFCAPGPLSEYTLDGQAKIAVPMAMPVRITDNAICVAGIVPDNQGYTPYCYADFDDNNVADFCATSESWESPGGTTFDLCFAEDGRPIDGRVASTRARVKLQPYTISVGNDPSDPSDDIKSAWVMLACEEMKGLGTELNEADEPVDIGKEVWYHTFDLSAPDHVAQGTMLNPPAVDYETGEFFEIFIDDWGYERYQTEIARRASLITQGTGGALRSENKTVALVLYKQGILNQGGPADIFGRFFVLPDEFDPMVDNPYAFEYMACEEIDDAGVRTSVDLLYPDGVNPNYVQGLCPAQAINLSGTTIVECDDGVVENCADLFPWDSDGDPDAGGFPTVTEWVQDVDNFNDESWVNPYDVAKGHRGYMDGDFIMLMYGWSPNWKATSNGQDAYNLYVRRSFDGGATWTTTPANLEGDGTEHCEWYGSGGQVEYEVCTTYGAGEFEQARNLSQLVGSKFTLLDPRFASTKGDTGGCVDAEGILCYSDDHEDDERDPSVFFVTYQTGDNSTVEESEATPLDMFYSRASEWGDEYSTVEVEIDGEIEERFDWIENKKNIHSAEAALATNPAGTFLYAIWNQWKEDAHEIPYESDAFFRRLWFDADADTGGSSGGTGGGAGGGGGGKP